MSEEKLKEVLEKTFNSLFEIPGKFARNSIDVAILSILFLRFELYFTDAEQIPKDEAIAFQFSF